MRRVGVSGLGPTWAGHKMALDKALSSIALRHLSVFKGVSNLVSPARPPESLRPKIKYNGGANTKPG